MVTQTSQCAKLANEAQPLNKNTPKAFFLFHFDTDAVADPGFSKWGGRSFVTNGGAHILFSGKKCMKLKEIGLKWGGARLLAPCYSKITIFL